MVTAISILLSCPFCHNPTLQHYRLPTVTTNVTRGSSYRISARTTNHEDLRGPTDVEVGDTDCLTSLSIHGEHPTYSLREPREWLVRASAAY